MIVGSLKIFETLMICLMQMIW